MVTYLIPPGHNDGLLDRIEIEHCGFDLPQLNTVSPDFHLKVFAAQVREAALHPPKNPNPPPRDPPDLVETNFLSVIVEQQNLHVLDRVTNRDNVTGDLTSVIDEVPPDGA